MYKITESEILMGRDTEFPLSLELRQNLDELLMAVNKFRDIYNQVMVVSSGYRPDHYNTDAHGAANSPHKTCQAVDFHDRDGRLKMYCLQNVKVLEECGLYMENPANTPTWTHLQTRATKNRIFNP